MEPELGDLLIVLACAACAYGYAEGGLLSREMGGWRAICWILAFSTPLAITLLGSYLLWRGGVRRIDSASAWAGLFHQILVSQFLGFAFYYRGLAFGGVTKMSQVQQFQSVLAVLAAGVILGERLDLRLWIVSGLLLLFVVASRWSLQSLRAGVTNDYQKNP
jgi:drug/metabolite transporter (DMT)-like permease